MRLLVEDKIPGKKWKWEEVEGYGHPSFATQVLLNQSAMIDTPTGMAWVAMLRVRMHHMNYSKIVLNLDTASGHWNSGFKAVVLMETLQQMYIHNVQNHMHNQLLFSTLSKTQPINILETCTFLTHGISSFCFEI